MTNKAVFTKDLASRKLHVTREFDAPVDKVWRAWTEASLLDKWWAPKPWKAETKTMDFKDGGFWLYCMAGPNGEASWCRVNFSRITPQQNFSTDTSFCDEGGNILDSFPTMHWHIEFKATVTGAKVEIAITFDTDDDLEKIIGMGFEDGFTMGLGNLDELLETL